MEGGPPGKRRRRPPAKRESDGASDAYADASENAEWFDDIVDQSESEDGGFGGFAVRRPEMNSTDQILSLIHI